ncbi:PPC domain-containing DNA-binding protein [Sedimentibacter sp. MB31-C6]|uniref:PPC domain-containing DNA-binding protein n=1 Tax=Sedimentibacter sp. MB31-C6 TaxID=3109366 RepID=UPI002DDD1D15|nr:PPC domain-containing DNA-binding protein [Sedimentibacter sp. MB36-C1]WSI03509.1 PPC domain-containing DNA-binding protein [Sedimentibacter sp. MB36-C1]
MDVKRNVIKSGVKRVVAGRIPRGEDLLTGIKEICKEYDIKHGYIPMLIGSLDKGRFIYAISDEKAPIGFAYSDPVDLEGPLELIYAQGLIGVEESGELSIHVHMLVSDKYMRVFAGHTTEGGNIVAATGEIIIHELEKAEYIRKFDEKTGFKLFQIQ